MGIPYGNNNHRKEACHEYTNPERKLAYRQRKIEAEICNPTDNDLRHVEPKEEEPMGRIQKLTGAEREEIQCLLVVEKSTDHGDNL